MFDVVLLDVELLCWLIFYCYDVCCRLYAIVDFVFFFFKQKTAYEMRISDWSSDVCSSDLRGGRRGVPRPAGQEVRLAQRGRAPRRARPPGSQAQVAPG